VLGILMYHSYTPVPARRPRPPDSCSLHFFSRSKRHRPAIAQRKAARPSRHLRATHHRPFQDPNSAATQHTQRTAAVTYLQSHVPNPGYRVSLISPGQLAAMTTSAVKILIHGASGRMGKALLRLAAEDATLDVVGAVVGRSPSQRVVDGVPFFAASELDGVPAFDVAIDFSLPQGFAPILALCAQRAKPLVSGTTGLDKSQRMALCDAAQQIPLVWASNFSLGVAVLTELVERAAGSLPGWDCDIIEAHHVHKQDAPSGTALTLGESAIGSGAQPRYASLRAGDIVGEHTVQFTGLGERVELVHRTTNRDIFARGALHAAKRLIGKPAGSYRVRDLLL